MKIKNISEENSMEESAKKQSWWKRNWKWALPVGGCLTMTVIIIVAVGSVAYGIATVIGESHAQEDAMKAVVVNKQVITLLGEPIEANGMTGGSFNTSNGHKTANITIPIKGPKGEATLYVEGDGVGKLWTYSKMEVFIESEDTIINLLEADNLDL
ncbi:hypothetical protein SCB49_07487 [unidentified eubacterium SCB49]|nr:hypothetical protein SCB49_07487 [unidentified eubacterium SCB49]